MLPLYDENPALEEGIVPCSLPDLGPRAQTLRRAQAAVPFPTSGHDRYPATCRKPPTKLDLLCKNLQKRTFIPPLAIGPTHPPIQWLLGPPTLEIKLTTHLLLVLRLRICGALHPPQYIFMAWCLIK